MYGQIDFDNEDPVQLEFDKKNKKRKIKVSVDENDKFNSK